MRHRYTSEGLDQSTALLRESKQYPVCNTIRSNFPAKRQAETYQYELQRATASICLSSSGGNRAQSSQISGDDEFGEHPTDPPDPNAHHSGDQQHLPLGTRFH